MKSESDRQAGMQAGCLLAVIFLCIAVVGVGGFMSLVENKKNKELPGAEELTANLAAYAQIVDGAKEGKDATAAVGAVVPVDVTDDEPALDYDIWKALPAGNHPESDAEVKTIATLSYFEKEFKRYYDAGESGFAHACRIKVVDRATGTLIRQGEVTGQPPSIAAEGSKNVGVLGDEAVVAFIVGTADETGGSVP